MATPNQKLTELERQIREQEAAFEASEAARFSAAAGVPIPSAPQLPVKTRAQEKQQAEAAAREAEQNQGSRRKLLVWIALTAVLLLIVWAKFHRTAMPALADGSPASLKPNEVWLKSPVMATVGAVQGPFTLVDVVRTTRLRLRNATGQEFETQLLGLRAEPYPAPTPAPGAFADTLDVDGWKFHLYSMTKAYLGDKPLYLLSLGESLEGPAYLLRNPNGKDPLGDTAELVNAALVRQGYALLDLDAPDHPFRNEMLEAQKAALADYDAKSANGDSMFYLFPLTFPGEALK